MTSIPLARRRRRGRKVRSLLLRYLGLSVAGVVFLAPVAYMFAASLTPSDRVLSGFAAFDPRYWSFDNFAGISRSLSSTSTGFLWQFFAVSFVVTLSVVIAGLFVNSLAAYSLSRLSWRGRGPVLLGVLLLLIVPFEALAVPLYTILGDFRNTLGIQIVPFVANAFSIYLFYTFFVGLPTSIDEAARVDGATPWRIYRSIIVPMSRPVFASVAILTFLAQWGSFLWPVLTISEPSLRPLPLQISVFSGQTPPDWGQMMAFGVLLVLPVLVVFVAFQRWFVEGVASSAVKG